MTKFSITEAALEGFRLTRERFGAVLAWTVVQVVFTVGAGVMVMRVPAFAQLQTLLAQADKKPDLPAMQALFSELMPVFLAFMLAALMVDAVLKAGVYRTVLRLGGPLQLGIDEFRMLAVSLATGVLATVPVLIGAVFMGLMAAIGALFFGVIIYAASFVLMAVIYVRLSLAGPMTLSEGRITIMASARLTKGRAWPLFGSYFLAVVLYFLVAILVGIVESGVRGVMGIENAAGVMSVSSLAGLVVQGLIAGLGVAIVQAPAAQAYRQFVGGPDQAEIF